MKKAVIIIVLVLGSFMQISAQENFNPDSIKIIEIEPFNYILYEMTGSYTQMNAAFTSLWEESTKQFLDYDEAFFAMYYNSPSNTPEKELKWAVGTKLKSNDDVLIPLLKKKWESKTVAKAIYKGNFGKGLSDAYAKSITWITQKGYTINGQNMQRNIGKVQPDANGELCGTVEITFPIVKSK
jgi:effector-binding domain-containing protein